LFCNTRKGLLIRFVIDYLVADNNVKCVTVAATRDLDFITPDLYRILTVLTLILWITGYVKYCSNVLIGNLLKTDAGEPKLRLIEA